MLGAGYGWVQLAINGNTAALSIGIMAVLIIAKMMATGLSVGSGGSGGVFAPGLMIGAMTGGALWPLLSHVDGIVPAVPGPFVVIGMMTLFGGIAKAPLAIMIMVSEMTGGYELLVPCMISVFIAYFTTGRSYIYESQVPARTDSPAHQAEYSIPLLQRVKIKDAMHKSFITTTPEIPVSELSGMMKASHVDGVPVMKGRKLLGIVTALDIARIPEAKWPETPAQSVMTTELVVGHPYQTVYQAWEIMSQKNISHLPIVEDSDGRYLIGIMDMRDIAACYRWAAPVPASAI